MKILLSWIKDFVDISNISTDDLVRRLNQIGFEVEEKIELGKNFKHVIVSKIIDIQKHPNADKLVVCKVDIGNGKTTQIVTGATNMKVGDLVPLAQDGAHLPCGKEIKNSVLRGVDSLGMFCGGDELGLDNSMYEGAETYGLLILHKGEKVGQSFAQALGLDETILDINVLPNRPDCNSVIGIAKEIAGAFNLKYNAPDLSFDVCNLPNDIDIDVQEKTLCKRYMGAKIVDIKNGQSPEIIRRRLKLLGHNPHSFFVDVTNYVLLEMGQPMHTFDCDKIGKKLIIRTAKQGESLLALDGNTYNLTPQNLVIASTQKPLVIAGIIGGEESGTYETTKNVFLESAIFDYANIRHSKNDLGVLTDSCLRYSKGVFQNSAKAGLFRALHIICKYKAGKICADIKDVGGDETKIKKIKTSVKRTNEILALDISGDDMVAILNGLGIQSTIKGDVITSVVPFERTDLERDCDIIEEVGRIYGLDNIDENNTTKCRLMTRGKITNEQQNINALKNACAGEGYFEMISYQFVSPKLIENMGDCTDTYIKVLNPIGKEFSVMRKSLVPEALSAIDFNTKQSNKDLRLFELARVFIPKSLPLTELPNEKTHLCLSICSDNEDFYSLKNSLCNIVSVMGVSLAFKEGQENFLHPYKSADIILYNRKIGCIGQVHPFVCDKFSIPKNTYVAEIDLTEILKRNIDNKKASIPPKFPSLEKDIALVVPNDMPAGKLVDAIVTKCSADIEEPCVFDVYQGEQVGEGKKSVAIKFKIKQKDGTFTDEQILDIMKKAINACEKIGATLRQ